MDQPESDDYRFNPPPNWPQVPEGYRPQRGWNPPQSWEPAPEGWQFWVRADGSDASNAVPSSGAGVKALTAGPGPSETTQSSPRALALKTPPHGNRRPAFPVKLPGGPARRPVGLPVSPRPPAPDSPAGGIYLPRTGGVTIRFGAEASRALAPEAKHAPAAPEAEVAPDAKVPDATPALDAKALDATATVGTESPVEARTTDAVAAPDPEVTPEVVAAPDAEVAARPEALAEPETTADAEPEAPEDTPRTKAWAAFMSAHRAGGTAGIEASRAVGWPTRTPTGDEGGNGWPPAATSAPMQPSGKPDALAASEFTWIPWQPRAAGDTAGIVPVAGVVRTDPTLGPTVSVSLTDAPVREGGTSKTDVVPVGLTPATKPAVAVPMTRREARRIREAKQRRQRVLAGAGVLTCAVVGAAGAYVVTRDSGEPPSSAPARDTAVASSDGPSLAGAGAERVPVASSTAVETAKTKAPDTTRTYKATTAAAYSFTSTSAAPGAGVVKPKATTPAAATPAKTTAAPKPATSKPVASQPVAASPTTSKPATTQPTTTQPTPTATATPTATPTATSTQTPTATSTEPTATATSTAPEVTASATAPAPESTATTTSAATATQAGA